MSYDDKKVNEQVHKLIKKALSVDVSNIDCRDALGVYNLKKNTIYLWEGLRRQGWIKKNQNESKSLSFDAFCKKMVYLSEDTVNALVFKTSRDNDLTLVNDEWVKMFNNLTNAGLVGKLFKYFLFGEDPEEIDGAVELQFNPPKLIPEILKQILDKTNDADYQKCYDRVMKTLNKSEAKLLEEKFPVQTFSSTGRVPDHYPMFALRNIKVERWNGLGMLNNHWVHYMRNVKDEHFKFKAQRSTSRNVKYVYHCGCSMCKPVKKGSKKEIGQLWKQTLKDAEWAFDYEHDYDEEDY
jgi:hypothetical protein